MPWRFFIGAFALISVMASFVCRKQQDTTPYVFEKTAYFPQMPLSIENPVTNEGRLLGRLLFYDPILSKDSTISCSSCHKQEFAFSDAPNRFSIGINNHEMKRNTMPLFNLAWYSSLFWDGRSSSIENQVFEPVRAHDEMNLSWKEVVRRVKNNIRYEDLFKQAFGEKEMDSVLIAKSIAQFERTLISNNSKFDQVLRGESFLSEDEYVGYELVNDQTKGNCLHCHTTDGNGLGTTGLLTNNGLDRANSFADYLDPGKGGITGDEMEGGQFKIPSLRNLAFTAPYMHDGRFNTLNEVMDFYSENVEGSYNLDTKMILPQKGEVRLTEKEKEQIIAFILTLSDSSFVKNPKHSNPFK